LKEGLTPIFHLVLALVNYSHL